MNFGEVIEHLKPKGLTRARRPHWTSWDHLCLYGTQQMRIGRTVNKEGGLAPWPGVAHPTADLDILADDWETY
jgi:hypothetical protein